MSTAPATFFTRITEVNRPAEEVFAFLANLLNDPTWRREWVDARAVTQGDQAVGSRTVLVEPIDAGTRITFEYELEDGRLVRLLGPFLERAGRRALDGDLPALTRLLESLPPATP